MQSAVDLRHIIRNQGVTRSQALRPSQAGVALNRFLRRTVTDRERGEFCTQLSVLLQARVSLHRSLDVLARQAGKTAMRRVIEQLAKDLQKGNSFAGALGLHPTVFDRLFVVTTEVGQETGRLPEVLTHLASHLEKMNALKRRMLQALTYPSLVIGVAVLAVLFLLLFIVPTFAEMFKSFQVELPTSTRAVLAVSQLVTDYGAAMIVTGIVCLLAFRSMIRLDRVKAVFQSKLFALPIMGDIALKNHVARFCRTLGTLLQAQVSLVDALGITQRISSHPEIQQEIGEILRCVKKGRAIAEPMVDSKIFPPMVSHMIAVGEETSELDRMLLKVAAYYETELDARIESLSSVLEPLIVLLLGFVVAGILVSMYMPMFELVNVVGAN